MAGNIAKRWRTVRACNPDDSPLSHPPHPPPTIIHLHRPKRLRWAGFSNQFNNKETATYNLRIIVTRRGESAWLRVIPYNRLGRQSNLEWILWICCLVWPGPEVLRAKVSHLLWIKISGLHFVVGGAFSTCAIHLCHFHVGIESCPG